MAQFMSGITVYGADVDCTSTGNTQIITLPNGFAVTQVQVLLTAVSGLIIASTLSVGTNSTSFNNINSAVILTALSTLNNVLTLNSAGTSIHCSTGDVITCRVSIAATASVYSVQVLVTGFPL